MSERPAHSRNPDSPITDEVDPHRNIMFFWTRQEGAAARTYKLSSGDPPECLRCPAIMLELSRNEDGLEQVPIYDPVPPAYSENDPHPMMPSTHSDPSTPPEPTRPSRRDIIAHSHRIVCVPNTIDLPGSPYRPNFATNTPRRQCTQLTTETPRKCILINEPYRGPYYPTDVENSLPIAIAVYARYDTGSDGMWIGIRHICGACMCQRLTWMRFDDFMKYSREVEAGRQVFVANDEFVWGGVLDERALVRGWDERNEDGVRGFEGPDELPWVLLEVWMERGRVAEEEDTDSEEDESESEAENEDEDEGEEEAEEAVDRRCEERSEGPGEVSEESHYEDSEDRSLFLSESDGGPPIWLFVILTAVLILLLFTDCS